MVEQETDTRRSAKVQTAEPAEHAAPDVSGPLPSVSEGTRGDLLVGAPAGAYLVTGLIARGGCGAVYRARHRSLDQLAAVKVLHAPLALLPKMVERFKREVEVVGMLCHPNIVEIYEVGTLADRRPFYAMEHLSGRTLATIVEEEGRMSPVEVIEVIEPVCAALVAAHAAGVVHRDVKASNIMVGDPRPGSVKLLDFGIAKLIGPPDGSNALLSLTSEGRQVGTLTIMAPEQLVGGPVDGRIDIYALGVLLYRLLTGRLPFDGKNALTLADQHINAPPPRPSLRAPISPALDALVLRCLEKRPERRYKSVEELAEALRSAVHPARAPHEGARAGTDLALGVGVYLEVRMPADDLDDALGDDISAILDLAEDELSRAHYTLAFTTGNSVLGVRVLPDDPAARPGARADAIEVALALHEKVSARSSADPRAHTNVSVHVDGLTLRSGVSADVAVTGGALVNAGAWAPLGDVLAVCATASVIEGVEGLGAHDGGAPHAAFNIVPGPSWAPDPVRIRPALVTVTRRVRP